MGNMYDFEHIAFHDIAMNGNTAWFCNVGYNALFQMDLSTGILKLLAFFPNDIYSCKQVYSPITYFENKLYIAPRNGNHLLIFDLKDFSFTSIELDLQKYVGDKVFNLFNCIEVIKGKIYLFPGRFHAIVEFDPITHTVSYFDDWYEELALKFSNEENDKMIFHEIHIDTDGNCLLPCWKSRDIVKVNICTREYAVLGPLPGSETSLSDAIDMNGKILFSLKDEGGIWSDYGKNVLTMEKLQFTYTGGLFLNHYEEWLYIVPWLGEAVIRHSTMTGANEIIYKLPGKITEKNSWIPYKNNTFCQKRIKENELAIYSSFDSTLILVEMNTGQTKIVKFVLEEQDKKIIKSYLYKLMSGAGHLVFETVNFNLGDFLSAISDANDTCNVC